MAIRRGSKMKSTRKLPSLLQRNSFMRGAKAEALFADLVMDRMLQLQLDEGIPIYVIPIRTPERVAALRQQQSRPASDPPALPIVPTLRRAAQGPC
jgi:hypothetical protein